MYQILLFATLILLLVYYIYSKLRVPKSLSHISSKYAFNLFLENFKSVAYERKVKEMIENEYLESKVQLSWLEGKYFVRVMTIEAAKSIYSDAKTFPKLIPSDVGPDSLLGNFLGESVLFSSHDVWKKHRKVVNPPFKKQFEVNTFADTTRQFFSLVDRKKGCEVEDVHRFMQRITMDCLGKDILGTEFNSIVNPDVEFLVAYNSVMEHSFNPLYILAPFLDTRFNPFRRPAFEQLDKMNGYFKSILAEKRTWLENNTIEDSKLDLLSLLIKASQKEDSGFSDLDIQNNLTAFLLAGHDTTAFALSAALHLLAQHPDVQQKAREEVLSVMDYSYIGCDASQAKAPTLLQTKNMNYLLAVIKETLRMYPSVATLPDRYAAKDVEIDGYTIPKGTGIMLDTYCTHRDSKYFKDPNDFVPERFLDANSQVKDLPGFSPFGGGTRLCLGLNFSLLEQKVVLAMILSRYRLEHSTLDFSYRPLLMVDKSSLQFVPLA